MRLNRWLFSILCVLAFVLGGGGVAGASDANAPVDQPRAPAETRADAETEQVVQFGSADERAPKTEVANVAEKRLGQALPQLLPPIAPPPSLQTLVDERRDQLRERREAQLDAISGRYAYMSPWLVSYDRNMELYQDAMRQLHRQRRDHSQLHHDAWMDAMHPWSRPQRNWSRIRSYLTQMEQLDRQEARDAWLATRGYAFAGPIPW
jgi:hypothetical protein